MSTGRTKVLIGADGSTLPSRALLALSVLGLDAVCVRDTRELFWQGLRADDATILVVLGPQGLPGLPRDDLGESLDDLGGGLPGYDLRDVFDAWRSVGIQCRVVQIDEFEIHERALQFLLGGLPVEPPVIQQSESLELRCA